MGKRHRFKTTVAWIVVSGAVMTAPAVAEDNSFVSDPTKVDDTTDGWQELSTSDMNGWQELSTSDMKYILESQHDGETIPIATKKLPPFTVTYEVTLMNWPAVAMLVIFATFFLLLVFMMIVLRRRKNRTS